MEHEILQNNNSQQTRTPNVDDNSPNVASAMLGVTQCCQLQYWVACFLCQHWFEQPNVDAIIGLN
jgi:hypothetical protein